jgi:sortase A
LEFALRIKSFALIIAGLIIVLWSASRVVTDILPALQPTPTSDEIILENYAPNSGPLGNPALDARVASSGEVESLPVTDMLLTAPTAALPTAAMPATSAPGPGSIPEPTSALGELTGAQPIGNPPAATEPALFIPTQDAAASSDDFLVEVQPTLAATQPAVRPAVPTRIVIPMIGLDAPVTLAASQKVSIAGKVYYQWLSPDKYASGWHTSSAYPGTPGNTVLNGHHNVFGKVFEHLVDLNIGETIDLYAGDTVFHYIVVNKMIVPERDAPIEQRLENARWLARSDDERLTLITCWPADNNTHRLIIVAIPDPARQ